MRPIGRIFHFFLRWLLKHRGYMPCLGVNLHLELKNATTHRPKTRSSHIYGLKVRQIRWCQPHAMKVECAVSILVTTYYMQYLFQLPLKIWSCQFSSPLM